jgi:hypothetical protein
MKALSIAGWQGFQQIFESLPVLQLQIVEGSHGEPAKKQIAPHHA